MIDARSELWRSDVLFVTLDALRFDVAALALEQGKTPFLSRVLPGGRWELRHSPGSFTYAAHHAFFAGFLPTPSVPGRHPRLFAARFSGSLTTDERTIVFDTPDIVTGFAAQGYHTVCVGGVGFFNKQTPVGNVLPSLFAESHWSESLGVACDASTENQVNLAIRIIERTAPRSRLFLFVNVSAMHEPSRIFSPGAAVDSSETQGAALAYCDAHLGRLFAAMSKRGRTLCIVCSDHGTAFGEDGFVGHRHGHRVVWEVPYAEFILEGER